MADENFETIEKRTLRKTMVRILPFVMILYVIAQLDRVNVGFAALKMNADLALSAEAFGLLSGIFYLGYVLFEVPSNMILPKVGAKIWIARIMITWGIVVILTGFVQSAGHLYILRFLLGVAEAGFFPGILLYLTNWFRKKERSIANAILMIAIPLGSIIGAPLSGWIMDNVQWGMAGWRWMFVLEGIPAIILGIVVLFLMVNSPKQAKWLTKEESEWLESELEKERMEANRINKTSKREMLKDNKVWILALLYCTQIAAAYGLAFWLPTIIKSLTTSLTTNLQVGWIAMIPAIVGVLSILFFGWNASRTNSYKMHLIVSFVIGIAGFIIAGFTTNYVWMIIALSIAAIGFYGYGPVFMAYMVSFFTKSTAPVGIALVNSVASIGGFIGPMIFGLVNIQNGMFIITALLFIGLLLLLPLKSDRQMAESSVSGEINNSTSKEQGTF